jgi:hypothetical protein
MRKLAKLATTHAQNIDNGSTMNRSMSTSIHASQLESLEEKILICDSAHQECLQQGNVVEALRCLETSCQLRSTRLSNHGIGADDVDRAHQALVTECNTTAMLSLQVNISLSPNADYIT